MTFNSALTASHLCSIPSNVSIKKNIKSEKVTHHQDAATTGKQLSDCIEIIEISEGIVMN